MDCMLDTKDNNFLFLPFYLYIQHKKNAHILFSYLVH